MGVAAAKTKPEIPVKLQPFVHDVQYDEAGRISRLSLRDAESEGLPSALGDIQRLPAIESLELRISKVDGHVLATLSRMKSLKSLAITTKRSRWTATQPEFLELSGLKSLRILSMKSWYVTESDAKQLQLSLPECTILDAWCCGCCMQCGKTHWKIAKAIDSGDVEAVKALIKQDNGDILRLVPQGHMFSPMKLRGKSDPEMDALLRKHGFYSRPR